MNIFRVTNPGAASRTPLPTTQKFRPGQILQGNILKLFPNQGAEIQLGSQRMIAHLEIGLKVGGNYHFQVESAGDLLKLKVLGEQSQRVPLEDLGRLLNQLGLKSSQVNTQFIKKLFGNQIPFDRGQIQQATELLNSAKNKPQAMNILIDMLARNLPIKQSVFESYLTVRTNSFQNGINAVLEQMSRTLPVSTHSSQSQINTMGTQLDDVQVKLQLHHLLTALASRPDNAEQLLTKEIIQQSATNQSGLFNVIQDLGFVSQKVNFSDWQANWTKYNQQTHLVPSVLKNEAIGQVQKSVKLSQASHVFQAIQSSLASVAQQSEITTQTKSQQSSQVSLPFSLNVEEVFAHLKNLNVNKSLVIEAANNWLGQWGKDVQFLVATGGKLSEVDFSTMIKTILNDFNSVLTQQERIKLQTLTNNPTNLANLHTVMKTLANEQQMNRISNLVDRRVANEAFLQLNPKQQFLDHVHFVLNRVGLNYEQQITMDKAPLLPYETVKGLLLEMITHQDMASSSTYQKLVHLINGLQIQSVHETPTFIQAHLQIPAERLGLINDMKLEFEGRKTEDGQVNPDFCRILFHLELGSLKETMIDMQIQNRSVSIVIYNNTKGIEQLATPFKEKLATSLADMDYRLSTIQYKHIEEKQKVPNQSAWKQNFSNEQGVDFRI